MRIRPIPLDFVFLVNCDAGNADDHGGGGV